MLAGAACKTDPARDAGADSTPPTAPAPAPSEALVEPVVTAPETPPTDATAPTAPEPPPTDAASERAPTGAAIQAGLAGFATVHEARVELHGDLWGSLADPAAGVTMGEVTLPTDHGAASLTVDWKPGDTVRRVMDEGESPLARPLYGPVRALVRDLASGDPATTCREARCVRTLADGGQHVFRFALSPSGQLRLLGVLRAEDRRITSDAETLTQVRAVFDAAIDGRLPGDWPR